MFSILALLFLLPADQFTVEVLPSVQRFTVVVENSPATVEVPKTLPPVATPYWETDEVYVQYWGAEWCGPCRATQPIVEQLCRENKLKLTVFDVDTVSLEVKRQAEVSFIPVLVLCRKGRQFARLSGQQSAASVQAFVDQWNRKADGTPKLKPIPQTRMEAVLVKPASVNYQGFQYTGRVCENPNCQMCAQIAAGLQGTIQYRQVEVQPPPQRNYGQEPASMDVVTRSIAVMNLKPSDVFADLGCGDGRALIAAVKSSGCTAVGVEIDPEKASEAWENVRLAGLTDKISITIGDARNFDTRRWGVTALYAYLYPELLAELRSKFDGVRVGVTPYHSVDGLEMTQVGDLFVFGQSFNSTCSGDDTHGFRSTHKPRVHSDYCCDRAHHDGYECSRQ